MQHAGVRLVMWGVYDAAGNSMDMVLGLPSETLAQLGIKGLPQDTVLPVKVQGDAEHLRIDWTR